MELLTVIAIFVGPIVAVSITLWHQSRKEKRNLKNQVFTTLMAQRGFPTSQQWIMALQLIDIVFSDRPKILGLWHEYYDMLHHEPTDQMLEQWERKKLELLSEIAKDLGYKHLQQIDIDKDTDLHAYLSKEGVTRGEYVERVLATGLVYLDPDGKLRLLTDACACAIDPDLGFVAAENNDGRFERWLVRRTKIRRGQ